MSPKRYHGGSSVRDGRQRRLEASSFKEVVQNYFNIPVMFRMTRAEFLAHPDRDTLKDGPFICACSFKQDEGPRNGQNADQIVLVIVDLDEAEHAGGFFKSPETIKDLLYPYNTIAFTTAKHTPEAPRIKIIVEVEPCDKKFNKLLVNHVINRLGLPKKFKGRTETETISQPQYRPIQFRDETHSAVLCSRTEGIALRVEDIPHDTLEESDDRDYAFMSEDYSEDLAFMPTPGLTLEQVREAIMSIDPDIDMNLWIKVAAALRHQFRSHEDARLAFELWNEWSSGGEKYPNEEELYYRWKTLNPDTIDKRPVRIATLFRYAMDAGWDNKKVILACKQSVIDWMNACDQEDKLLEEGCVRIVGIPFDDPMVEDLLIQCLQERFKAVSGKKPSKKSIEDQIARLRFRNRAEKESDELPEWLRPWIYVGTTNRFLNVVNDVEFIPESFDNYFGHHLMKKDEAPKGGRPEVRPAFFALNQKEIKRVDGVLYDPRVDEAKPIFTFRGRTYFNSYKSSSLPAVDVDNAEAAGALFMEHLRVLISEEEYVLHVLHFIAHVVQYPGHKVPWAPLIQSNEGAGKNFLKDMLEAVLGDGNVKTVTSEVIEDKWTDWMCGAVLIVMNEVHIPGHHREKVTNKLKAFITDEVIPYVKKFVSTEVNIPNLTNAIAFTNFHDALHLSEGDRRWMAIESPLQTKEDIVELNATGHFKRMEILKKQWGGALRHWLLNFKIPDSFPINGPAPDTIYRQSVINDSKNRLQAFIEQVIEIGKDPLVQADLIHYDRVNSLTDTLQRNNAPPGKYLRRMGFIEYLGGKQFEIGGKHTTIWVHKKKFNEDLEGAPELALAERAKMEVEL